MNIQLCSEGRRTFTSVIVFGRDICIPSTIPCCIVYIITIKVTSADAWSTIHLVSRVFAFMLFSPLPPFTHPKYAQYPEEINFFKKFNYTLSLIVELYWYWHARLGSPAHVIKMTVSKNNFENGKRIMGLLSLAFSRQNPIHLLAGHIVLHTTIHSNERSMAITEEGKV